MRLATIQFVLIIVSSLGCQCSSNTTANPSPLIQPPTSSELAAVWSSPVATTSNPNQRCAPCHGDIVKSYQRSAKGQTSRSPTPLKTSESFTLGRLSVSVSNDGDIMQAEEGPYGGRQAKASLQIGSSSHSFASIIDGSYRLLPLMRDAPANRWLPLSGFRGSMTEGFESEAIGCAECHGLQQAEPSLNGISCDACHGNLESHIAAPSKKVSNAIHNRLRSSDGQGELCGRCHTLVSARLSGFQSQSSRSDIINQLDTFRAYERDTLLDERIAGQQRRLKASKCFNDSNSPPRCSACHDPHGNMASQVKTRSTCLNCHTDTKPCLDKRGAAVDSDCAQCHFNAIQEDKTPHSTRIDHRIVRSRVPMVYWSTLPQTKLRPDFNPIHTQALSPQHAAAENALFRLKFSSAPNDKAFQALVQSRLAWPSTEATLALMTYELEQKNIEQARILRNEYELVAQLSDEHLLNWADALERSGYLQEAMKTLNEMKATTREARLLKLKILVKQNDFTAVEAAFRSHQDSLLDSADGVAILAALEQHRNQIVAAKQWLKRAISMSPYRSDYYLDLAQLLLSMEDTKGALETCSHGLKFIPKSTAMLNLRGRIFYDSGKIYLAARDWDKSLAINRRQFDIFARMMRAALETGDRNSAVSIFETGRKTLPDDPRWTELEKLLLRDKTR